MKPSFKGADSYRLKRRGIGAEAIHANQQVGDRVGLAIGFTAENDMLGKPSQILHEHDADGDGDRPQLSDRERLDFLIGSDETDERGRIEATVGMGDVGPGNSDDAWISGERPIAELRELAIVARWQILASLKHLLFDETVVVEKPLGGGGYGSLLFDNLRKCAINAEQGFFDCHAADLKADFRRIELSKPADWQPDFPRAAPIALR